MLWSKMMTCVLTEGGFVCSFVVEQIQSLQAFLMWLRTPGFPNTNKYKEEKWIKNTPQKEHKPCRIHSNGKVLESKYWCGRIFDRAGEHEQGINKTWWECCWGGEAIYGNLKGCIFVTLNKDSESPRARETVAEEVRVMLLGRDEGEMWANRRWGWWRWLRLRRRKVGCCSALGQPLPCWWGGSLSQLCWDRGRRGAAGQDGQGGRWPPGPGEGPAVTLGGVEAGELELDDVLQLQVPHWLPLRCTKTKTHTQPVMMGNSGYAPGEGIFSLF